MLPSRWYKNTEERLKYDDVAAQGREAILDRSDQKAFVGQIKQKLDTYKLFFQINLEDRRYKLRKMMEKENDDMIYELDKMVEPVSKKRERLKENARGIRHQNEVDKQALADEKYFERLRLSDDSIRGIQRLKHTEELVKDWEQIKKIKVRLEREEACEKRFWADKVKEAEEKMIQREMEELAVKNIISTDIVNQMKEREEEREKRKLQEKEDQKYNKIHSEKVNEQLMAEKAKALELDRKKKEEYRKSLDRHLEVRKCIDAKNLEREKAHDALMFEENTLKIKDTNFHLIRNKHEVRKHTENYIRFNNCIKEQRKKENEMINKSVIKTQLDKEKKMRQMEKEKQAKYNQLIKTIKEAQKDQLKESDKKKMLLKEEMLKDREEMSVKIAEDIKKEEIKNQQEQQKIYDYIAVLKQQIEFNEKLAKIKKDEHDNEISIMMQEEERYQQLLKQVRERETLMHVHPWRINKAI